jgi:hypothetical protein
MEEMLCLQQKVGKGRGGGWRAERSLIADIGKPKAHRGGAETRRTAKFGDRSTAKGRLRHTNRTGYRADTGPAFFLDPAHFL